ncbi:hypothetical protein J19TS2_63130 [Cohnella xylanilytica]|uniref:Uncharacterized protein n=1 Tax=Cohnella xylanilytica TaxID=557555 RepID=A0A841TU45_9BACL|nr:hypothetical protein [Cohnella xylanilytica]MBB6691796.1 hypothetical protein [Cohnella xylanilytica]GIO16758.1 hypothetical protein J19TS2_63130 [Cohnella xylanilytica]
MSFEIEHAKWIKWHLRRRMGERKDALKRGHGYGNQLFAEKIWWPLVNVIKLRRRCEIPELIGIVT